MAPGHTHHIEFGVGKFPEGLLVPLLVTHVAEEGCGEVMEG